LPPQSTSANSNLLSQSRWLLFGALGVFLLFCAPTTSVAAAEKALYLKQSAALVGAAESYLTSKAVRINFGNDQIYLVAKAPTWRVVMFNNITKKGLAMPYQQWISHHPTWNHGKDIDWIPAEHLLKVASPVIDGRYCTDFVLAELLPNGHLVPKAGGACGHLLTAEVDGLASQACHILQRTLDLPQTAGVPLRFTLNRQSRRVEGMKFVMGGDAHLVSTSTIKTVPLQPSLFTYPVNFKAVAIEYEVLYDSKTMNSNVEQFLDAFK
jgi:hypothetical protein